MSFCHLEIMDNLSQSVFFGVLKDKDLSWRLSCC